MMSKSGLETPLADFNPAATSVPLPVPQATADITMVVCNRATIVPQVTDYRVLTDMHLPLAIKSGGKTLFLGAKQGQIQFGVPDGDATPAEIEALRARRDEMQTAMAKAAGK